MRKKKKKNHKNKYQQTEREKKQTKKRIRVWEQNEDTTKEKKRKTIIYQKYVYRGDTKINKMKKNTKIHVKLKRGISQEYSSSY